MIATIAGKELRSLFASPLAWVLLTVTQIIACYVFLRRLDDFLQLQSQLVRLASPPGATEVVAPPVFGWAAFVFLVTVPLLAMRLIAEERRNRTLVLIISAPVSITQIVLGKFLGLLAFLLMTVAITTVMPLSLAGATSLDYGLLAGLVAGLALLAASFAAVSLFVSCLTSHPVAAAVGSFAALLLMMLAGDAAIEGLRSRGWLLAASLAQVLSPITNYKPFAKGVLDTYAVACSLLLVVFFLALAARQLEAQRLRG